MTTTPVDWKALDELVAKKKTGPFTLVNSAAYTALVNAYPALRSMAGGEGWQPRNEAIQNERQRCANIARFAMRFCKTDVGEGVARAILEAIENDAFDRNGEPLPKPPATGAQP